MEENVQAIDGVQPIAQESSTGQSANDDLANKKYLKKIFKKDYGIQD